MFGLPLRPKNDCHSPAADFFDMTRKRPPSSVRASSSDFFGHPRRRDDFWDRPFCGTPPFGLDPFRSERDLLYPPPRSALHYSSLPRSGFVEEPTIAFEKAAAELYAALERADEELQTMNKTFNNQIAGLTQWLPNHYIDSLWSVYCDWDGYPVDETHPKIHKLAPTASVTTFSTISKRIAKAAEAMRQHNYLPPDACRGPMSSGLPSGKVTDFDSWDYDNIRTTLRKLQISLDAIDERISVVRQQRHRMSSLVREIVAAKQLLESIREVWESVLPRREEKGKRPYERAADGYFGSGPSTMSSGMDI